jgi:hypothetical protein
MSRRRYRWDDEAQALVEIDADYTGAERRAQTSTEELTYGGMRATDGTPINTKRRHREYLKAVGGAMASDFTETRARAEKVRHDYLTTGGDHRERKEQLGRALYEKNRRRR